MFKLYAYSVERFVNAPPKNLTDGELYEAIKVLAFPITWHYEERDSWASGLRTGVYTPSRQELEEITSPEQRLALFKSLTKATLSRKDIPESLHTYVWDLFTKTNGWDDLEDIEF